jgi:hypothetical protein
MIHLSKPNIVAIVQGKKAGGGCKGDVGSAIA